jgi:hypothetical protein
LTAGHGLRAPELQLTRLRSRLWEHCRLDCECLKADQQIRNRT